MTVKNVDYCCIIHNVNKFEAINLLENSVLKHHGLALSGEVYFYYIIVCV